MTEYEYTVMLEQDEDGAYIATVPALPGVHTFGDTEEEALEMIKDAIALWIGYLQDKGEPVPRERGMASRLSDKVEAT